MIRTLLADADAASENLVQKLHLDNLFRLCVSISMFVLAVFLWSFRVIPHLFPLFILLAAYTFPYLLVWWLLSLKKGLRGMDYGLNTLDIVAITFTIHLTGGPQSPFFYLYIVPFLIQAFHFDLGTIVWDGPLSIFCYAILLARHKETFTSRALPAYAGQLIFLGMMLATAIATVCLLRRKERALKKGMRALGTTVSFLNDLNGTALQGSLESSQEQIVKHLAGVLKPFHAFARLWIYNEPWKTLRGFGEHPARQSGSPNHLPVAACPAFALRQPFKYSPSDGDPCPSEQFDYTSHLCLPLANDTEIYGVLFLATYEKAPWDPGDIHFFEMLAQSITLTLQRKIIFERLQEKMSELNFSFEVGASALATFVGSTQGIDETTLHILDGVLSILKVDRASLMLWNAQSQCLQTQWVRGGDFQIQSPMKLALGEGIAGWALKIGEPYWAEYAMGDPHYKSSAQSIKSLLCVPVYTIDRTPLGVINAVTVHHPRAFEAREINFLKTFGQQAALAIENAHLHQKDRSNIEQLKELDKMKSQFLSLVSHDLRGPLTGVQGFCEVLKQQSLGRLNAPQLNLMEQLERQVQLQKRMVDDLLDLARMEKGQLSIHPTPSNLLSLIKEEIDKSQSDANERKVTLRFLPAKMNGWPSVLADEDRIRQVLWNLIHNALKFTTEEGTVTVRLATTDDSFTVEVSDTGVGLSSETQERIFDKFFQISPGGSKGSQGLGLGLAICKEIILAHHGKIWAQSPGLGRGTTISFSLPIAKSSSANACSSSLAA